MKARLGLLVLVALAGCAGGGGRGEDVAACMPAPLGGVVLHLRGSMNSWGADEDHAFAWSCDAYYLNVELEREQEFKIADAAWTPATSFGADPEDPRPVQTSVPAALVADSSPGKSTHIRHAFGGAHTLALRFQDGQPSLTVGPLNYSDPSTGRSTTRACSAAVSIPAIPRTSSPSVRSSPAPRSTTRWRRRPASMR